MIRSLPTKGKKLHGGWILTRMRKREGENRTNWLLIKHRDEFAREGKKNRILDEDTSVASGRSMDEITAGKGRGPKPFVTAKRTRAPAKAEGKSHRAAARAPSAKKRSRSVAVRSSRSPRKKASKKGQTASDPKMPPFIAPQLCTSVDRPPAGGEWVHEIKFDGYRIQMRAEWRAPITSLKAHPFRTFNQKRPQLGKAGALSFALLNTCLGQDVS